MRPIKFKVWYPDDKQMDTAYEIKSLGGQMVDSINGERYPHDILLQFTGLCDKNGREIYEGDIVRNTYKYAQSHVSEVFIEGGNTYLSGEDLSTGGDMLLCDYADRCEVLGNVFETPKLLEAAK